MAEGTLVITISNQVAAPPIVSPAPGLVFISGWHVPSDAEVVTLYTYLGGYAVAGGHLKSTNAIDWNTPNVGADNSSGFNGIGAGHRQESTGLFQGVGDVMTFWTTTIGGDPGHYLEWDVVVNHADGYRANSLPDAGFSIRLIKDDSTDPSTVTDFDGNIYPTVKIGTQVWMAANLATTHYADGTAIPIVTDDAAWAALTTAGMCYYNNTP